MYKIYDVQQMVCGNDTACKMETHYTEQKNPIPFCNFCNSYRDILKKIRRRGGGAMEDVYTQRGIYRGQCGKGKRRKRALMRVPKNKRHHARQRKRVDCYDMRYIVYFYISSIFVISSIISDVIPATKHSMYKVVNCYYKILYSETFSAKINMNE